ncbi:MAG: hypothetical protein KDA83_07800 [Planctomycetales bacterium]|nr:hypothetical protein [Planctomycetales bacterium]
MSQAKNTQEKKPLRFKDDKPRKRWWAGVLLLLYVVFAGVPIVLVWIGRWISFATKDQVEIAGTIGDSFGLANATFSAIALLLVAYTLKLQTEELEITRDDNQQARLFAAETAQANKEISKQQSQNVEAQITGLLVEQTRFLLQQADPEERWTYQYHLNRAANQFYSDELKRQLSKDSSRPYQTAEFRRRFSSLRNLRGELKSNETCSLLANIPNRGFNELQTLLQKVAFNCAYLLLCLGTTGPDEYREPLIAIQNKLELSMIPLRGIESRLQANSATEAFTIWRAFIQKLVEALDDDVLSGE